MIDRTEIGESMPFGGEYRSKKDQQTITILKRAGMVIEGRYDQDGKQTTVIVADTTTGSRKEIPVTARIRTFNGIDYTAYIPSKSNIAAIRKTIATG